jgi:hypothetical protein
MNEVGVACDREGERRGAYRVLVAKTEGKKQLGKPMRRQKDNIKMDVKEVKGRTWTELVWLRIRTRGRFF